VSSDEPVLRINGLRHILQMRRSYAVPLVAQVVLLHALRWTSGESPVNRDVLAIVFDPSISPTVTINACPDETLGDPSSVFGFAECDDSCADIITW
jgi:hypothetical protein